MINPITGGEEVENNHAGSLFEKLASIMGKLNRIPKNGHNDVFHYDFILEADLCDTIRPLLAEHGIGLIYSVVNYEFLESHQTSRGATQYHVVVTVEITIGDKTGATLKGFAVGEALDSQDKGINKAQTAAVKYWLYKTFLVSAGDDTERGNATSERKNAGDPKGLTTAQSMERKYSPAPPTMGIDISDGPMLPSQRHTR